jgi:superfamily II DNA or RNA helicase/diadenosine tetraphosphate (Ap4A) HIT family hydrolase
MSDPCPFCSTTIPRLAFESDQYVVMWDGFPVSPGHALVIPRRHIRTWFDATLTEQIALLDGIERAKQEILRLYQPDGFNIGINVDAAGGQTVFHLHVHVIPRYAGDIPDPRGGVRNVIPGKGNYLRFSAGAHHLAAVPHEGALIRGEDDPLLPHLLAHLDRATAVDVCVAFVQLSGLRLVEERFRDLLNRGGKIRFLTGDYLDITDPQALLELLDLEGKIELRVFQTRGVSFHPKSYIFHFSDGTTTALVGSSNLTGSALKAGIEWNYRVVTSANAKGIAEVLSAFDRLFHHPSTQPVSGEWIKEYAARRRTQALPENSIGSDSPERPPEPHLVQTEALNALERSRADGNSAGLVVLATGLGKTWLSAFDSNRPGFERVLFVAHREEILNQAIGVFRRIRPNATLGRYTGTDKVSDSEVLFASVQTLGRQRHLRGFDRTRFDYIIVDEFHHAAASTYRNLISHFTPKFMLGLTATPERTDGGDLLALCQENLVYRCDVARGITEKLLVPFHYFGVPDEVDYRNIPWRNNRFDEEELTRALATQKRAQNAHEQYTARAGVRTLAFCCSRRHSDFMAEYFCSLGVKAVSVHSGPGSAPRSASLEALAAGDISLVFAVDMFNEGIDLPNVDTVMMLRPTESSIIWMQQFGRGLRRAQDKSHLTVIDYIGNHRIFLNKPRTLLNLDAGDRNIDHALNLLRDGDLALPPGCEVTYDLRAVEILRSLLRQNSSLDALQAHYVDFRELLGQRPTASEIFHDGINPRSLRQSHGSWLNFVRTMGDISGEGSEALTKAAGFLSALETTPMTKSFKMLTLLAMLDEDAFPGSIGIERLAGSFARIARRSANLLKDVGADLNDPKALVRLLEANPIAAWAGGLGTKGQSYFTYENGVFSSQVIDAPELRAPLQEFARELAEWRLSEYLTRSVQSEPEELHFTCKVSHSDGRPILFLPSRDSLPGLPAGWTPIEANLKRCEANFTKIAVNVVRQPGEDGNLLAEILRDWFGSEAGLPGTAHRVSFVRSGEVLKMSPVRGEAPTERALELWRTYMREEIPPLFGQKFSEAIWHTGFIATKHAIFLMVTLEKKKHQESHQYQDKFLSPVDFQWQSQNRTTQKGRHGQMLREHQRLGITVNLFVRRSKKIGQRAAPFYFCGTVNFMRWHGEKPITIEWQLSVAVPERLRSILLIDS